MPEMVWQMRGSATKEQNSEAPFQPKFMASANRHVFQLQLHHQQCLLHQQEMPASRYPFQHDNQYQNQVQSKEKYAGNLNGPERERLSDGNNEEDT